MSRKTLDLAGLLTKPSAAVFAENTAITASKPVLDQLAQYEAAKLPVEVHLYARGGHGFGMGSRSKLASINGWTKRLTEWLGDSGFLTKPGGK